MPNIITSRTRLLYERPPDPPWVCNVASDHAYGLAAWYPLGDKTARYLDWSPTRRFPLTVNGAIGRTPFFSGGGWGYSNSGSTSNWLSGTNPVAAVPLTIMGWCYVNSTATFMSAVIIGDSAGSNYFNVSFNDGGTTGTVEAGTQDGGASEVDARTGAILSTGVWFHFVAVYSAAASRVIYVNGLLNTASETTSKTPSGIGQINLGGYRIGASTFGALNGGLADVRVYRSAWTAGQIADFYGKRRFDLYWQLGRVAYPKAVATAQDTPELYGQPFGNSGYRQMIQHLAG